jgi:hypothetical protein
MTTRAFTAEHVFLMLQGARNVTSRVQIKLVNKKGGSASQQSWKLKGSAHPKPKQDLADPKLPTKVQSVQYRYSNFGSFYCPQPLRPAQQSKGEIITHSSSIIKRISQYKHISLILSPDTHIGRSYRCAHAPHRVCNFGSAATTHTLMYVL